MSSNKKKIISLLTDKKFIAAAAITAVTVFVIAIQRRDPKLVIDVTVDPEKITVDDQEIPFEVKSK
jgi:hypothetical protein